MSQMPTQRKADDRFKIHHKGGRFVFALFLHVIFWTGLSCLLLIINLFTTLLFPPWSVYVAIAWVNFLVIHAATVVIFVDSKNGHLIEFVDCYTQLLPTYLFADETDKSSDETVNTKSNKLFNVCFCNEDDDSEDKKDNNNDDDETKLLLDQKKKMDMFFMKKNGSIIFLTFFTHIIVWMVTSFLLFVINLTTSLLLPPWFIFPSFFWGLGVIIHGIISLTIIHSRGGDFYVFAERYADIFQLKEKTE